MAIDSKTVAISSTSILVACASVAFVTVSVASFVAFGVGIKLVAAIVVAAMFCVGFVLVSSALIVPDDIVPIDVEALSHAVGNGNIVATASKLNEMHADVTQRIADDEPRGFAASARRLLAVIDDMIELVSDERFSKSGNVSDQQLLSSLVTSWLPDIVSSVATNTRYLSSRGAARRKSEENMSEIEAQLARFLEVVGRDPDYFEAHAVTSNNLNRAIAYVAERHGYKNQPASFDPTATVTCGTTPVRMVMRSMTPDYDPAAAIRETVEEMGENETVVFVCHPGYLDQFILSTSSLTEDRTKEVDALISPALRAWLEAQPDLRLVDYRDL